MGVKVFLLKCDSAVCLLRYGVVCRRCKPCAKVASRKFQHKSNSAQAGNKYTYVYSYTCIHKWAQLKSKIQHTGTWSAGAWPPRRLCYRSAVLFRHLRLTALTFPPPKKSGARLRYVVWNCVTWNYVGREGLIRGCRCFGGKTCLYIQDLHWR
jgi:hypothetical protein